jgi:SAM-dependent methyltransferase
MPGPDVSFWQERFDAGNTPWDRGAPNPQLRVWVGMGLFRPGMRVTVPGCGSGHELPLLAGLGCLVTAIDYAPAALERARATLAAAAQSAEVIEADVLTWQPSDPADVVYEQTCLCALHPDRWVAYARQLVRWLRPGGNLAALFMQAWRDGAADGFVAGPPYHCDIGAMRALFPSETWAWPAPPYARVPHPIGTEELAVVLTRR